jgi:hypothetical protein
MRKEFPSTIANSFTHFKIYRLTHSYVKRAVKLFCPSQNYESEEAKINQGQKIPQYSVLYQF